MTAVMKSLDAFAEWAASWRVPETTTPEPARFDSPLHRIVFAAITAAGPRGATCEEIEEALRGRHQTISARIRELVLSGRIVDTGRRRVNATGRSARVYRELESMLTVRSI